MSDIDISCCDTEQGVMLGVLIGLSVVLIAVWKFSFLKPFKLAAVLVHELGHALATKLTCGKVNSIVVNGDEGGETKHVGGVWWVVTPAGYVGSSFIGACLIVASGSPLGSLIAAGIMAVFMLAALCWSRSKWSIGLSIATLLLLILALALFLTSVDLRAIAARVMVGVFGVLNGLFAVYDIIDDTIKRDISGSDASVCAGHMGCKSGRCCGVCWVVYAIIFFLLAVFIAVFIVTPLTSDNPEMPKF